MKTRWFAIFFLLLTACTPSPPAPAPKDILFFPETGHSVQPPFSAFLQQPGKLDLLGYPITERMTEDGWDVQYFQFGRLERHPENDPAYLVTVGWLGEKLNRTMPPANHTITGDFHRFYTENGDSVQFGKPIGDPFLLDGRLVQDFQSARFIWPANTDVPVLLAPIGETYFLIHHPPDALSPIAAPDGATIFRIDPPAIASSNLHCTISITETPARNLFRVTVHLTDPDGKPIARYAPIIDAGKQYSLPPTLANGYTHGLFFLPNPPALLRAFTADGKTERCHTAFQSEN